MKLIYEAIVIGDRLEWTGERPPTSADPQRVTITLEEVADELPPPADPSVVAAALKRVREQGGAFSSIKDPVAWQREIREDRVLPGREP